LEEQTEARYIVQFEQLNGFAQGDTVTAAQVAPTDNDLGYLLRIGALLPDNREQNGLKAQIAAIEENEKRQLAADANAAFEAITAAEAQADAKKHAKKPKDSATTNAPAPGDGAGTADPPVDDTKDKP
jgi:hypothetical protein